MDIGEGAKLIPSIISGVKGAIDISKVINESLKEGDIKSAKEKFSDLREKLIDIQINMTDLKQVNIDLNQEIENLNKQIEAMKDFYIKADEYQLILGELAGMRAYIKKSASEDEKKNPLCATCFEDKKLSYYSFEDISGRYDKLECPRCKSKWWVQHNRSALSGTYRGS